jgi:hypothetical protein
MRLSVGSAGCGRGKLSALTVRKNSFFGLSRLETGHDTSSCRTARTKGFTDSAISTTRCNSALERPDFA